MAKPKPLKTAARVVVSIARHHLEEFLGKETLGILASAQTEDGKKRPDALIDDWLNAPGAQRDIEAAIEKADACVLKRCKDRDIQQIALQLPQRRLPKLLEVITGLPEATDEQMLEDALRRELQTTASNLAPGLVDVAIKAYMDCLRLALLPVENQALLVIGRAALRTEQELKQFRQEVRDLFQQLEQELQRPLPPPPPPLPIPLNKPPRAEYFTGRDAAMAQLLADLQPGCVVTLCGPGGIGKTALAAEAIHNLAPGAEPPERFPDGIIFHSFYGKPDIALAFEYIVHSFDKEARDFSPEAVFHLLSRKKALLVLDGAEQVGDLPAVLAVCGGCGVLVTSRRMDDAAAH